MPETEAKQEEYDTYIKTHTDKFGNQDLTKWPLSENTNNTYYLKNNVIVKYQLRNFDKKVKVPESEMNTTGNDLVARYKIHITQLK